MHLNVFLLMIKFMVNGKSNIKNNKIKDKYGFIKNVDFYYINNEFNNDLNNYLEIINHFMVCLCLCNSIIIVHKKLEIEKNN